MSRARSKARNCVVQALYEWQLTGHSIKNIFEQFVVERNTTKFDVDYFKDLIEGVSNNVIDIDAKVQPHLDRPINEVDPVERAVLRMGSYELMFKLDVPYRVVINESVEAAKTFGADQGHKYVNGVLDKVAQQAREIEIAAKAKSSNKR